MLFIFTFSSLEHYFRRNIILPLEPQADCLSPPISSTRAAPCLAGVCTGMAKELTALVDKQISVITNDGRNIIGILRGVDQTTNLILEECFERVYSVSSGVEQAVLGLYIIRGDNIAVIGELDEELDKQLDLSSIRAPPLKSIMH